MLHLSHDIILDVFRCLNNDTLQKVRQAFPELDWMEESEKRQNTRKIVSFLKKHFPKNDRERALNRGLMKLFNRINGDVVYEISVRRWETSWEMNRWEIPCFWIIHQYKKYSGVWYDEILRRHEGFETHIPIPIEKFKRTILHDKHRIDYISVRWFDKETDFVRSVILYVSDLADEDCIYLDREE